MEYTIKTKDEVKDILMGTSLITETVVTPSQPTLVSADKNSFSPNDVRDILFGGSARQETTDFLPTPDSELLPTAYDSFSQTSSLLEEDEETPWFRRAGEAIEYNISSTIGSGKTPAQQEELNKLLALLREPDQTTGEVSLFGHGLAKIAETGSVGTRFVTGLIDAVNIGGGVAPDLVEKAVAETGGVDGVLGTTLNSILSGFGRYKKAENSRALAEDFAEAAGGFLEFAEVIPATGLVSRLRKLDIVSDEDLRKAIRNNPEIAAFATREAREEAQARAASVASQNVDIAEQLIEAFETTTRKTISVLDAETGRRVIDPTQARQAAQETLEEMGKDVTGFEQDLVMPILNPDKFNGIVALASDYRKAFPEQFDPNKNIIENLLDITVERKIVPSGQLIDDLNNYGLSFEEYVLGVFGSGSTAGRVLQKLSQIADVR